MAGKECGFWRQQFAKANSTVKHGTLGHLGCQILSMHHPCYPRADVLLAVYLFIYDQFFGPSVNAY